MLSVDKMTLLYYYCIFIIVYLVFVQLQAFYLCTRDLMINMLINMLTVVYTKGQILILVLAYSIC